MNIKDIKTVKVKNNKLIVNSNDKCRIPQDIHNKDYIVILEWVKRGNTIEPEFTEERVLSNKKKELKNKVEEMYQKNIQENIRYDGNTFQADKKSQDALIKVIITAPKYFEIDWLDSNNLFIHLNLEELKELNNVILKRTQREFIKKVNLKKVINSYKTIEELNSIKIGDDNE